ncbi:hypothetical protein FG386_001817 [Cryptosporidium ryanae]|uniref:uncharacterized protein n=1 Tax=Cryptosporidium ryanae TaxID=515981 RepID=UPI00351A4DD4|nr:hypothetical protein FG386_001817 [Cryptosporidium ryanae]
MEGFHPDWQGYLKPLIALVAPESIQEHLRNSISSFRPKTSLFCDKCLELKCLTHKELLNPSISSFVTPSRSLIKSSLTISSSPSAHLGSRTGHGLGGIDILSANWMYKVRYDTPALYIICFDWQEYPLEEEGSGASVESQEKINSLESDAISVIKSISSILKKRQSPPSVLIFVILPTGTRDPQSCVTCFRKNHFPELQAIFVTCGLKHQKQLNIRIERLVEMAYETSQAYYSENERRWRKSAIKAQTAGLTASTENIINSFSIKSASSGLRGSFAGAVQASLSPKFKRNSYVSLSNSSNLSLIRNGNAVGYPSGVQITAKNSSLTSVSSGNGSCSITQLQSRILLIRYCIKSAVMNEFCGNFVLATKQYAAAWDNIMSETNIPSYQFVVFCNIISIRLYHIHVINGEIREAMNHLKIHTKILREFGLNHAKFSFLSSLWLSLVLQKLASILFFYIVNKQSHDLLDANAEGELDLQVIRSRFSYPDGIESSVIPLSVNAKDPDRARFPGPDSGPDSFHGQESPRGGVDDDTPVPSGPAERADDLGSILSRIASSIRSVVVKIKAPVPRGPVATASAGSSEKRKKGDSVTDGCRNQDDDAIDILLNISKLYKVSAEYSHKSRKELLQMSEDYGENFFDSVNDVGGEVLSPVSLGCLQELSSPDSFLEYEHKPDTPKGFFGSLSAFSSLYIGCDGVNVKQIEDKSLLCEVLSSCEVTRRYIGRLLRTDSLFNRCVSLFYMSAVVYRHFYPNKLKTLFTSNIINENEFCNDTEAVSVTRSNDMGDNFGSRNHMNRFFYMISFSFAEYLFDENYINCSLSIYESIFKAIIPKHIFSEIDGLTRINEQELRDACKRRNMSVWNTISQQIMSTCFHITSNFIKSRTWLFIRKICLRIITCLSIQNLSLEDNRRELTKMCGLVSWSCESGDADFLVKLNEKILNPRGGCAGSCSLSSKQHDQYIYSVVTSFLTVINSKRSWTESDGDSDKNSIHFYILFFCYIIIACDIENNSNNNITCKRDIFEFHDWITKLYVKIINQKDEHALEKSCSMAARRSKNVILTHFLYNTYSTLKYEADSPGNVKIEIHHLPNFVYKLVNERMDIELISSVGILKTVVRNFELYEFKEENNFNIRIRLDCVIREVDFAQANNGPSDSSRCYYREYLPEVMIIGIFSYFHVGPCENDYIKFAINSVKYFDFKKVVGKNSKYVYNYSYVQFCVRNPPLSYFSNFGSWIRNSKTLVYSTPRLNVVPGGFLDTGTNTVVSPIPLFKVPFDQVYFASRIRFPYNPLPTFCKLSTRNILLTDGANERMSSIRGKIDSLKRACRLWLLSPFNAIDVASSEAEDRLDCVEKTTYNSVVNELRPLELLLRLPGGVNEDFTIEICLGVSELMPRSPSARSRSCGDGSESPTSRLGYIKVPDANGESSGGGWSVVLSENKIPLSNTNDSGNNVISNNQNVLLYSSSAPGSARFRFSYGLLAGTGGGSAAESQLSYALNAKDQLVMARFGGAGSEAGPACCLTAEGGGHSVRDEPPTPFFKVMRDEGLVLENERGVSGGGDLRGLLLLVPLFLSIDRNGEYEIAVRVRILDSGVDDCGGQGRCTPNIIIHELNFSRRWFVGECVTIKSEVPTMDSLNGSVNYLGPNHGRLESRIVPVNDGASQLLFVAFEVLNKQYKDVVFVEEFVLPREFSLVDASFPIALGGYESNSALISISKDDLRKRYLSESGKPVSGEVPEAVVSLLYNLSCEVKPFKDDLRFLEFVLHPFQLIFPSNESNLVCGDPGEMKLSFKSLPIRYSLLDDLLNTLILPYTRFFPDNKKPLKNSSKEEYMKYVALLSLVVQTVAVIYFMRISRIKRDDEDGLYFNTCAVVMSEIVKLICSLFIIFREKRYKVKELVHTLRNEIFHSLKSNLLVGIPGLLYVVQNNLLFIALSNLPGAVYHVTYQLKILVTAILSVVIMGKKLSKKKWFSLLLLTVGAIMVQPGKGNSSLSPLGLQGKEGFLGLCSVLLACITSGLAGVFLEKLLKDDNTTIWGRNIQLALYGIVFGYVCCITGKEGAEISEKGFFYGFNALVWFVILLQAIGGIIVAAVLKYADNILKCFGNALSIIMSCILSWRLGDYNISPIFAFGSFLVIWSIFIYGLEQILPRATLFTKLKYLFKKNSRNNIVAKYKTLREKSSESEFDLVNIEEVIPKGVQMAIISNNV